MATAASQRKTLPFVRLFSGWLSPRLARLPLTPNQLTLLSLAFGLAAAAAFADDDRAASILGAVLLTVSYVLDNCDGEVARLKNMSSRFGARLDDFADWLVHSVLFLALGFSLAREDGSDVWLWFGIAAAAGGSINYILGLLADRRRPAVAAAPAAEDAMPASTVEWCAYVFRELFRADFCFIILIFAMLGELRWLLIVAGIGAHAYWMFRAVRATSQFHV